MTSPSPRARLRRSPASGGDRCSAALPDLDDPGGDARPGSKDAGGGFRSSGTGIASGGFFTI